MSILDLDLPTPVAITRTKKSLVGICFRQEDNELVVKLEWLIPQEDGTVHRATEAVPPNKLSAWPGAQAMIASLKSAVLARKLE